MSSSDSQFIVAFREEMRDGFAVFAKEMRDGLSQVSSRVDRSNQLLLETRDELHQVKTDLEGAKTELREAMVETKTELRELRTELADTRKDISSKLTGISGFLIQSEQSHILNGKRIDDLESRVRSLEKEKRGPPECQLGDKFASQSQSLRSYLYGFTMKMIEWHCPESSVGAHCTRPLAPVNFSEKS